MKIMLKPECVANDQAFKDCTLGAIYEAKFCDNPLVKALIGAPLSQEEIDELENSAQCLTFKDDEGDSVWCTVNEVIFVKPEH